MECSENPSAVLAIKYPSTALFKGISLDMINSPVSTDKLLNDWWIKPKEI
jgi:hypothetical protein